MRAVFILLISVTCFGLSAQSKLDSAQRDLKRLKNGALLVRLQENSRTIEALKKAGKNERAEEYRKKQYRENRATLLSFRETFDFCPVYFFYASDSDSIRYGKLEGVLFDVNREQVPAAKVPRHYFTGEFAETPNLGIDGFIIMDRFMIPLEEPFPFYQREHAFLGLVTYSKAQILERLDKKLNDHYELWFGAKR